jgi:hypothetical protein
MFTNIGQVTGNLNVANVIASSGMFTNIGQVTGNLSVANIIATNAFLTNALPLLQGGTGSTTASGARTNLGLGNLALQANSLVSITGGAIDGTTIGTTTASSGAFTTLSATSNVTIDTNTFFVDSVANRVGILTTLPGAQLDIKGNIRLSGSTSGYVELAPQPAAGSTSYRLPSADGTANTFLRTAGNGLLSWATVISGASVSDDTTTNANYYPLWATATSGTPTTIYVSSTKLYFNPSTGTLNATVFNSLSDASQKTNIVSITDSSDIISKINGVEFNWIDGGKKSAGVIAQELEKILPHLVDTSEEGIKSVNYAGIIAYLIEAVKELGIKVKNLENR